jgi:O-acetylserine/cysteine efflux transporter
VPKLDVAAALLVALLWGLQFVSSKIGVAAFPPLLFVALRFALVAALLLPFAGRPSGRDLRAAAILSVFFGSLCFGLFFSGLRLGTAGLSAALSQLMPPFSILFAVPVLGERPSLRVFAGVTIAFGGVAVALAGPGGGVPLLAALLAAGGAAAQGLGTVLLRRLGPVPPMRLLAYISLLAAPQLALLPR